MPNTQILVVEDEYIVAKDIQNTLMKLGYSVPAIVSSGEEAIKKVNETQPDLVLMDIVLKGDIDGIEAANQIKNSNDIPVIYVTAYADKATLSRAKVTEPFGYIIKPFEERDLHSTIEMTLYKQKMEKKLKESEKKYRLLFENLNVGIYRVTPGKDGEFVDVNPAFVNILDYENKREIFNLKVSDIYADPKNRMKFTSKITKDGSVRNEKLELKTKSGAPIIVSDTGIAIKDDNGEVLYFDGILEDITERIHMEDALRASEERYRRLVELVPAPMVVHEKGRFIYVNPATIELIGATSPEELIGRPIIDFIHPDEQELIRARTHEIEDGKEIPGSINIKMVCLDGLIKNVEMRSTPITYHDKPAGQMVFRDITEPKEIEHELRESEEKYRNLVERANDGIVIVQDGIIKLVNTRLEQMTGYSAMDVIDKPFTSYLHPDEVSKVVNRYKKRMAGKKVPAIYESSILHKDGSKIKVEISGGLITYQEKPADLVIIRDITERKRVEEEIKKNEERFHLIFENISDVIFSVDTTAILTDVSASVEQFSGYKPEELIGKPFTELKFLTPESLENTLKNMKRILAGDNPPFTEYEFITKDGKKKLAEVKSTPIYKGGKLVEIIAIARDISHRKIS